VDFSNNLAKVLFDFVKLHNELLSRDEGHRVLRERSLSYVDYYPKKEKDVLRDFFLATRIKSGTPVELGMNSPGILLDRVTILTVKLLHVVSPEESAEVRQTISEVLSLSTCFRPAKRSLLKKQSGLQVSLESFEGALLHLAASNLRMWLSQDIFYSDNHWQDYDYNVADLVELWGYENKFRNACIIAIDDWYIASSDDYMSADC